MPDLLPQSNTILPPIPDKIYFEISEAAGLCNLKPYVLRYWEQEFSQLRPEKRIGNRRFYKAKDILLIRQISDLLYNQGFTIEGARTKLAKPSDSSNASFLQEIAQELETIISECKSGA